MSSYFDNSGLPQGWFLSTYFVPLNGVYFLFICMLCDFLVVAGNWTSKYYVMITLWSDSPPSLGFAVLFDCWRLWSISSDTLLNYFYKICIPCPVVTEICFPLSHVQQMCWQICPWMKGAKKKNRMKRPPHTQMRKNRNLMSNQNRRIAAIHNNMDLFAFWAAFQFLFHIYFSITNLSIVTFSFFFSIQTSEIAIPFSCIQI